MDDGGGTPTRAKMQGKFRVVAWVDDGEEHLQGLKTRTSCGLLACMVVGRTPTVAKNIIRHKYAALSQPCILISLHNDLN